MKKQSHQHHHRYPQTLLDLQHLEGGTYGTLRLIARDRDTLEIQLGTDFLRVNADIASQIGQVIESFAGGPPPTMTVEIDEDEETEIIVEEEGDGPRLSRRRSHRRRHVE